MKEVVIEQFLRDEVEAAGGMCEKFVSPGKRGVPDRIITWPCGVIHFVETKAPGKGAKLHQKRDHEQRRKLGVAVFVLNTREKVAKYIADCVLLLT